MGPRGKRGIGLLFMLLLLVLMAPSFSWGKRVEDIRVLGHKKIEKDAILEKLTNKKGKPLDEEAVRKEVRKLFDTGYFQDIEVIEEKGFKRWGDPHLSGGGKTFHRGYPV